MSLFWPKAMPTVAAVSAGASLMPSPRKTVFARCVSSRTISSFCSGVWPAYDLGDADLLGQVAHLRLAVAGNQHHAVEAVLAASGGG